MTKDGVRFDPMVPEQGEFYMDSGEDCGWYRILTLSDKGDSLVVANGRYDECEYLAKALNEGKMKLVVAVRNGNKARQHYLIGGQEGLKQLTGKE